MEWEITFPTPWVFLVRLKGLEPTRIAAREPKSRMSTNSITGAYSVFEITGVENGAVNLSLRWQHLNLACLPIPSQAHISFEHGALTGPHPCGGGRSFRIAYTKVGKKSRAASSPSLLPGFPPMTGRRPPASRCASPPFQTVRCVKRLKLGLTNHRAGRIIFHEVSES